MLIESSQRSDVTFTTRISALFWRKASATFNLDTAVRRTDIL
jgi:hypothetical protein